MAISSILANPEKFTAVATAVMALTAVAATFIAVAALIIARKSQREATAKEIYRDYLTLAFHHPEFAEARPGDAIHEPKYRWFAARRALLAARRALLPRDALLNEAAAEIGVEEAPVRACDRFDQRRVRDPLPPREPGE